MYTEMEISGPRHNLSYTVELLLMDTPQRRTLAIRRTINLEPVIYKTESMRIQWKFSVRTLEEGGRF